MFIEGDRTEREIAGVLNSQNETNGLGRPWTRGAVHRLLTNEKYIGNNVYNRTSFKLKKKRVANPPDIWVRADGVFAPVVDTKTFQAAQHLIEKRSRRFTDEEMLGRLAALLTELGWLSGVIIDEREDMPSSSAYRTRFGSLLRAYKLIGYSAARDYAYLETNRVLRAMHPEGVSQTVATIERLGGTIRRDHISDLLTVNDEFTASIVVSRCFRTATGALRWRIRLDTSFRPDITVALRMDPANRGVLDYYLLPRIDIGDSRLGLAEENGLSLDAYRYDSLEAFFRLAARSPIRGAA
jgi:hypothetical protein